MKRIHLFIFFLPLFLSVSLVCFGQRDIQYKIYQFPQNAIPRIDGDFSDWEMVPASYNIGLDQLKETVKGLGFNLDPKDYNIDVKVGWVNGLNRLYFYVQAYDDYWDFNDKALLQDIFELVIDGDLSGGAFIKKNNENSRRIPVEELHFKGHGAHAQNYHIFTPVKDKDASMIWGNTPWIKDFPYFNIANNYNFTQGESGNLKMEFWITPFDHTDYSGIDRSTITQLIENEIIGMSWCVIDYDGNNKPEAFINLAHDTRMIYDASYLNLFKLMPLEDNNKKAIDANLSFIEVDRNLRWIQFIDKSIGDIKSWHWDFGDGNISNEKSPSHYYKKAGEWTVVLTITGPEGVSIRSKVWDVVTQ